jgi:hypothetical protein
VERQTLIQCNVYFSVLTRTSVGDDFILTSHKERILLFFDTMHVKQKVLKLGSLKLGDWQQTY